MKNFITKYLRGLFSLSLILCFATANGQTIKNDIFWHDTDGNPIYSQGGGVLQVGDTYYWYGVKYNGAVDYLKNPGGGKNGNSSYNAITCYSSKDLANWKFEGNSMTTADVNGGWIGRVGVTYNAKTKKYVLLSQLNAGLMFATSNTPNGHFTYHHTQNKITNVVNDMSGDQSVYTDEDGKAYLVFSNKSGRTHLYVSALRESDYLNAEPAVNIYNSKSGGREGSIMFKQNGTYYFCSSDLHGWNTSQTYCISSKNIFGPYSSEFVMQNTDKDYSHVTQCGLAVEVKGANGSFVIFGGDRWADFAGNGVGYNQWMPITFNGTTPVFHSLSQWNINAAQGTWSVGSGNNYVMNPNIEADRISVTTLTGWTKTGSVGGNTGGSHDPGRYALSQSSSSAYQSTIFQNIAVPNGTYTLSAWVKSSGGQNKANIFAKNFGGNEMDYSINRSISSWTQISISNIKVTNGSIQIGVYSDAKAGNWLNVDDFSLVKTSGNTCNAVATITSASNSFCAGGNLKLTANAGASYKWFNGTTQVSTAATYTATSAGSYTVEVTNSEGCSATSVAKTLTVNATPVITPYLQIDAGEWNQASSSIVCAGSSIVAGPQPNNKTGWSWSGPNAYTSSNREITLETITTKQAGNYIATYTDSNGCSATSIYTITVNSAPTATISTSGAASICTDGSVVLTASAGSSYVWKNGTTQVGTSATLAAKTAGSYTVEVTNAGGCKATSTATTVSVNTLPTATITASGATTFCTGGSVVLTASAGSSYVWKNGTTQVGTSATLAATTAGSYTVEVTNAGGCKATSTATTVSVNTLPTTTITASGPTTFCSGSSVALTASAGSSYKWFNGKTQVGTSATLAATTAGSYTVEVTNAGGCKATSTATTVSVNTLPTATITASGATTFCAGGSVVLSGSAGSSYKWFNGTTQVGTAATLTATTAGSYTVEVTNASGCKATSTSTAVIVNAAAIATITANSSTIIPQGGSVVLKASAGSSYKWFYGTTQVGTGASYTATSAGSYTVEVTNASGCKATSTATTVNFNTNQPSLITITSPIANTSIEGVITITATVTDPDGTIAFVEYLDGNTIIGTTKAAPYNFVWNNPGEGNHVITVRVTDSNGGVTTSAPVTITAEATTTGVFGSATSNSLNGTVYPNPANGIVFIDSDMDLSDAKFTLVDVLGNEQEVKQMGNGTGATIDVSNFSAGTYVLIVSKNGSFLRKKIIFH